ncbi:MAG TPA: VWA domain-containing protein, partial [Planctomycetes bacterium]|nr:VWA domain-containing protein [Planctomycetota bacterium]
TKHSSQNGTRRAISGLQAILVGLIVLFSLEITVATDEASQRRPLDLPSGGGALSSLAYEIEEPEFDSNVIEFYGGYYEGDAFFWCLDRSTSMGPQNPGDKLEMLKAEVTDAIKQLSEDNEFGLVSFATSVTWFKNRPVRATGAKKQAAIEWVNSMQPYGATCISLGVVKALEISTHSLMSNRRILLVGDGGPTCPGYSSATMLEEINGANWQRLPIDTIDIGANQDGIEILKQIANQNDGTYRLID